MKRFLSLFLLAVMILTCAFVFSSCTKLPKSLLGEEGLLAVQKDGKWGFVNKKGKEVVPCKFCDVYPFENGSAIVYETDYVSCYYINAKGKPLFDRTFYRAYSFDVDGRAIVRETDGGPAELINEKGETIFTAKDISFGDGGIGKYRFTNDANKMGIVDLNGNIVLDPIYEYLSFIGKHEANELGSAIMDDRLHAVYVDDETGETVSCLIDFAGNVLCSGEIEFFIDDFYGDAALIRETKYDDDRNAVYRYAIIDRDGRSVVDELQVYAVAAINPGYLAFTVGYFTEWAGNHDQFVLYDWSGNLIYDCRGSGYYPVPYGFGENEFKVKDPDTNKYGMLSLQGETVIPCEYDDVTPFDANGCAVCQKGGTFYVIDREGKTVFDVTCDHLTTSDQFSGKYYLACYREGEKETYKLLNKKGELVKEFGSEYSFGNFEQAEESGETYFDLDYYCRSFKDGSFVVRDAESNEIVILNKKFKTVKFGSYDQIRLSDFD